MNKIKISAMNLRKKYNNYLLASFESVNTFESEENEYLRIIFAIKTQLEYLATRSKDFYDNKVFEAHIKKWIEVYSRYHQTLDLELEDLVDEKKDGDVCVQFDIQCIECSKKISILEKIMRDLNGFLIN